MKKVAMFCFALGLLCMGYAVTVFAAQAEGSVYTNDRYGFSLNLPPGHTSVTEPENGDGIIVTYGDGMVLRAYGALTPIVLGMDCAAIYEYAKTSFNEVTYARLNDAESWLALSGYKDGKVFYLKKFVGKSADYTVEMEYPKEKIELFNTFVKRVVGSFTPGDMTQ